MLSQNDFVLPVLAAALIQWIIGALWYGLLFRKSWRKLVGGTAEANSWRTVFTLCCSLVASLMLSFVLVTVLRLAGSATFNAGAALAVICWLGFIALPLLVQHVHERRPVNLFAINAGYWMVAMAVTGGILAAWR